MTEASLANLGVAKVQVRVDWEKLDDDLSKSKDKISSAFQQSGKLMRNVGAAMTAGLTVPIGALIGVSTKAASRVNELDSVNMLLGKSAGYSERYIREQTETVQGMGIEAAASREIVADFIKAELDLADASKVARVAQDAAVIAGENSTETTKTLTNAIITGRTELFKSAGMIIDLNQAYEDYAELTGKSTDSLTEQEKIQARVNATMAYGERIAGAYAQAMEDPGKVLRSYPRYLNDVAVAFGQNFIPAFKDAIFAGKDLLGWLKEAVSEGGALEPVIQKWGERFAGAAEFVGNLVDKLDDMDPVMVQTIADMLAMGAAMGPVLLVGGQVMSWAGSAAPVLTKLAGSFGMATTSTLGATAALGGLAAILAGVTIAMIHQANARQQQIKDIRDLRDEAIKTASSYEDYNQKMKGSRDQTEKLAGVTGGYGIHLAEARDKIEGLTEQEYNYLKMKEQLGDAIELTTEDLSAYFDEAGNAIQITGRFTEEAEEAAEAQRAFDEALSIASNFSSIVSMAKSYDKSLEEIAEKQARVQQLMAIKDSGGYLDGVWMSANDARDEIGKLEGEIGNLQESMQEMANQMVLDMYRATLSFDENADASMQAYFDMAAELGIISREASDLAMDNYYRAKGEIERNAILVDMNLPQSEIDSVMGMLSKIPSQISIKAVTSYVEARRGSAGFYFKDYTEGRAAGGPVMEDQPYLVGERGPELYVPQVSGTIISNSELMRAMERMGAVNQGGGRDQGGYVIVHANVNNEIDMHRLARQIADEMRRGS